MHCFSLAILGCLSQLPFPTVGTNWTFCGEVPLKIPSINCSSRRRHKMIACSIVGSWLNYCNSFYTGMSTLNLTNFSMYEIRWYALYCMKAGTTIFHRCSRNFTGYPSSSKLHSESPHWYSILRGAVRHLLHSESPHWYSILRGAVRHLLSAVVVWRASRRLHSSTQDLLSVHSRTILGSRAFRHVTTNEWNSLQGPFVTEIVYQLLNRDQYSPF